MFIMGYDGGLNFLSCKPTRDFKKSSSLYSKQFLHYPYVPQTFQKK